MSKIKILYRNRYRNRLHLTIQQSKACFIMKSIILD